MRRRRAKSILDDAVVGEHKLTAALGERRLGDAAIEIVVLADQNLGHGPSNRRVRHRRMIDGLFFTIGGNVPKSR
jgi:hypothetical protein